VGTEVFRRVENWQDMVATIETACGLRVKVLDPIEEADTTFWAAMISGSPFFEREEPFLVIEQGGGSVQLTVGQVDSHGGPEVFGQTSIPALGTVLLRQRFLANQTDMSLRNRRHVDTVSREVHEYANQQLQNELAQKFDLPDDKVPGRAFALGSVITNYYRTDVNSTVRSNADQHGKEVLLSWLYDPNIGGGLATKYAGRTIAKLFQEAGYHIQESEDEIKSALEQLAGIPCYAAALEHFGLDQLRICGTGLRYGVLFKAAFGLWDEVREYKGYEPPA